MTITDDDGNVVDEVVIVLNPDSPAMSSLFKELEEKRASVDNYVKSISREVTDDVEKSNFNPQMIKCCTDTSYQCDYERGKADGIKEFYTSLLGYKREINASNYPWNYIELVMIELLKEQKEQNES